jgi:hypothetical protein
MCTVTHDLEQAKVTTTLFYGSFEVRQNGTVGMSAVKIVQWIQNVSNRARRFLVTKSFFVIQQENPIIQWKYASQLVIPSLHDTTAKGTTSSLTVSIRSVSMRSHRQDENLQ